MSDVRSQPDTSSTGPLGLDPADLATCVSCGLCLPHCPTFRVTGEEAHSPRGRVDAMRGVQLDGMEIDDSFAEFMATCVQCRGCEPACPSGVPFGSLMEQTRSALVDSGRAVPRSQRIGLSVLGRHRTLLAGSTLLALGQRLRLVPGRLGLPRLPIRRPPPLEATGGDVWLFTGCVMDAWQRETHAHTAELITSVGVTYALPGPGGACCGALHAHAGLHDGAVDLARKVMASMPGGAPIVVDSAGCGAALKDYARLLGTTEATVFSARVVDALEWLDDHLDLLPDRRTDRPAVIVQDPCHLRNVQRLTDPTRRVLARVVDIVELDDDGLCCGAGGAYSVLQPELSGEIRDRKLAAIARAATASCAAVVASANPGCSMHLAAPLGELGISVRHPVDVVADAARVTRSD